MPRKVLRGSQLITKDLTVSGDVAVTGNLTVTGTLTPALGEDFVDTVTFHDPDAVTKKARLDCAGVTEGETRVLTVPDEDITIVGVGTAQTLTSKTLTRPKVGTSIDDTGGNEIIKTPATASAVNEFTVTNAATGNAPKISATGDDAIISIEITPKSTGRVIFGQRVVDLLTATTLNTASDQTYTVASMLGGILIRDPGGASRADKLPTAANLLAAVPGAKVGSAVQVVIRNNADANEVITITGEDGSVTLSGSGQSTTTITIAQNNSKILLLVFTNVGAATEAYTAYSVGTLVH